MKENTSPEVRGNAALALAHHLRKMSNQVQDLRKDAVLSRRNAPVLDEEIAKRLRKRDPAALLSESESLLECVVEQYRDFHYIGNRTLGEKAAADLNEIRELAVGKTAPDIEGKDVDGRPLRLHDYRGKIVVLTFWATWCAPCLAMIPHERELMQRMKGQPFAIIGINGDEDVTHLKEQILERKITWPSWLDGGPNGNIAKQWNVTAWPTVYVLDREGVIRYRGGNETMKLDQAVEELLKAQKR